MTPALPLDSAQVSETLRPLEQATMLPPAAFTDPAVLDWELDQIFCCGLDLRRARLAGERARAAS